MGLDNIPAIYPCKDKAIRDEENRIDCSSTQKQGLCPWKNQYESDPLLKQSRPTYGMLGTDCWYRGKWGNVLVQMLATKVPHDYSFYGDGMGDGVEGMSPEYCIEMSEFMKNHIEQFAFIAIEQYGEEEAKIYINDYIYAAWWLNFVANNSEGSEIWY